jgi:hypothetical protein
MDWLGSNLAGMMFAISMLLVIIMVIYIKLYVRLYVRIFYKGTLYRHYRRGRLLTENDQGGRVLLIPLIDRLETFDRESTESDEYPDEY